MGMQTKTYGHPPADEDKSGEPSGRSWRLALRRGFGRACPRCGGAPLYEGFLKVRRSCASCGLDFTGHRADDLPPYLTIFVVAKLITPLLLLSERLWTLSTVGSILVWSVTATALCLLLLPRIKGAVIGLQWANEMHGFGPGPGWSDRPAPGADEDEREPAMR